jgi:hypothetical protein
MTAGTGLKQTSLKQSGKTNETKSKNKARRNGKGDKEEIATHKVKGLGLLVLQKGEHLVKI